MNSKGIAGFNAGLARSVAGGYTPTEWATGDVITADKLNHMEEGIEASSSDEFIPIFTIRYDSTGKATATCDKTYEEILAAIIANKCFRGKFIYDDMQGSEEYCYLLTKSSEPSSDDNFTFEQFTVYASNMTINVITRKQIKYHSDGTIEYEFASRNFEL